MCAIAGVIDLGCDSQTAEKILSTMKRRGPDAQGIFQAPGCTLFHSRLAIIDPEGGIQPMTLQTPEETYTLVYNGELYNTEELRHKLQSLGHSFRDRSDTEVVLHAYACWKEQCLEYFNGIFAFGIWEHKRRRLFLARDRMGVKPLFYTCHMSGLIFASELKTILRYPTVHASLDANGAAQILLLGPGRSPGSGVFRDLYEIEPGCCASFEKGKLSYRRYWKLRDREHRETFEETAEEVRFLVEDAIRRQMVSDVPMGAFLSGGLDSSLICAVCAKSLPAGERLTTFSVDYEDNAKYFIPGKFQPNSDNAYIEIMQDSLQSDHSFTVLTPQMLLDSLEEATLARDLPGMADVDFSLLAFCGQIRKRVKMALSGECADEIFGGYPWYRDPQLRDAEGFPWSQNLSQRQSLLSRDLKNRIDGKAFVSSLYEKTLVESDVLPGTDPLERRMKQMVNLNHRWFMQTLLDRKDRMSMYHGLEVRVPFCDYRIAEYLYGVPWSYKDYQGREKGLLRYACGDLLPEAVSTRKKSPYPKTFHPRYTQLVFERLEQLLQEKNAPLFSLVDRAGLKTLFGEGFSQPWYGQLMAAPQTAAFMLQLDFWLRAYRVELV